MGYDEVEPMLTAILDVQMGHFDGCAVELMIMTTAKPQVLEGGIGKVLRFRMEGKEVRRVFLGCVLGVWRTFSVASPAAGGRDHAEHLE